MSEKAPEETAFNELVALIQDIKSYEGGGIGAFLRFLEDSAAGTAREIEITQKVAELCKSTKARKPRKDKGTTRAKAKPEVLEEQESP